MNSNIEYIKNHKPDTLYVNPGRKGAYVHIVTDNEVILGEVEVTPRSRLAVSAFYVSEKGNWDTFKITKIKWHKTYGWREDGYVHVNQFDLTKMKHLIEILTTLDLSDTNKQRIELGHVQLDQLSALLSSSKGPDLVRQLSQSPDLHDDIYAVASKRKSIAEFKKLLSSETSELDWQKFFEKNQWIFGHGLQHIFLGSVTGKLETTTTGSNFLTAGKRADALMRTRAEISQYVLVEIKRNDTPLLQSSTYRSGCWGVSNEMSNAVTQVQKTVFEFSQEHFHDRLKDSEGKELGIDVYAIEPRSYLVIGNQSDLIENDDKVTCFELYRKNIHAPEIVTFDELYFRSKLLVENLNACSQECD